MKTKSILCFTLFLIVSLGLSNQSLAATYEDVAGTYSVYASSKFTVKGAFKDTDEVPGELNLYDDGTFDYAELPYPYLYTGDYSIVDDGKKIQLELDDRGLFALENMLTDWLNGLAEDEGIYISNIDFTFYDVNISTIKIDKNTNEPTKKLKIEVKGIVNAYVEDEGYQQRDFSYKAKLQFE